MDNCGLFFSVLILQVLSCYKSDGSFIISFSAVIHWMNLAQMYHCSRVTSIIYYTINIFSVCATQTI